MSEFFVVFVPFVVIYSPARSNENTDSMTVLTQPFDVLVVGGGNAGLCAAITARRAGARVLVLEIAIKDFRGGNSRHTRDIRTRMAASPFAGLLEPTTVAPAATVLTLR